MCRQPIAKAAAATVTHRVQVRGLQEFDGEEPFGLGVLRVAAERDQRRRIGERAQGPGEAKPVNALGKTGSITTTSQC